ncbi:hypothetical protein QBC35DRAFT_485486 [Podospora australis]|uniref:Apple domain-containing protein n=1 Tax=Podospora australis TaxID=1536484 RepID=A0AAN7ALZ3_9PEZI|nr:hypothetical protein QBC35DRAFT_485486 [Podospora australis]
MDPAPGADHNRHIASQQIDQQQLIQSHGIELADYSSLNQQQQRAARFAEYDHQPSLEVIEHSTLEVLSKHQQDQKDPQAFYPPPSLQQKSYSDLKAWENSQPIPLYPGQTPISAPGYNHPLSHLYAQPGQGGLDYYPHRPSTAYSAAGESGRGILAPEYVDANGRIAGEENPFQSAFDPQPLVADGGGPGGVGGVGNGGAGKGGREERLVCGVRRRLFWIIIAIGVSLAIIAVATGVGVGLSLGKKGDGEGATSTPSPTPTGPTRSLPVPLAQATTNSDLLITCPTNNLTLYTAQTDPSRRFLLLCGRDYHSGDGAMDLYNEPAPTVGECIDVCAQTQGCVGAGWGQQNGKFSCWLKGKLGKPNFAQHWYFVVEDTEGNGGGNLTVPNASPTGTGR